MRADSEKMKTDSEEKLRERIEEIRGADLDAARAAEDYVQSLAAPPGSLGKLTDAAVQLAGITGKVKNTLDRRRIIVMCADNGVVEEGVSSTPQIVTLAQALNMTRHLTGMSSLAAHFGNEVEVVDIGIATPYEEEGCGILQRRIRRGTGNLVREAAMTRQEAVKAIMVGIERAGQACEDGIDVIGGQYYFGAPCEERKLMAEGDGEFFHYALGSPYRSGPHRRDRKGRGTGHSRHVRRFPGSRHL